MAAGAGQRADLRVRRVERELRGQQRPRARLQQLDRRRPLGRREPLERQAQPARHHLLAPLDLPVRLQEQLRGLLLVRQLEQRLEVEKERLEAMKRHLHPPRSSPSNSPENPFLAVKNNRDLLSHNVEVR